MKKDNNYGKKQSNKTSSNEMKRTVKVQYKCKIRKMEMNQWRKRRRWWTNSIGSAEIRSWMYMLQMFVVNLFHRWRKSDAVFVFLSWSCLGEWLYEAHLSSKGARWPVACLGWRMSSRASTNHLWTGIERLYRVTGWRRSDWWSADPTEAVEDAF